MSIICFIGSMGAGKTFYANMIKNLIPNSSIHNISSKLKEVAATLFNCNINDLKTTSGKEKLWKYNLSQGRVLQLLGEACCNKISKTIWIDELLSSIKTICTVSPNHVIIIDDLRYIHELNELEKFCTIYNKKLLIVLVERKQNKDNKYDAGRDPNHSSEQEYLKITPNLIIDNTLSSKTNVNLIMSAYHKK